MGKQNRGKYQVISVPRPSDPAPLSAKAAAAAATAARTASARLPRDAATGLVSTPWIGKEWSSNKLGIKPKHETPTLEELRKRFPGLDDASLADADTSRTLDMDTAADADEDAGMEDADGAAAASATTKKPVTSLSRRGSLAPGSATKSRVGTRGNTPAPSAPASPSLRAAGTPARSVGSMDLSGVSHSPYTPSRTPLAGATWKTPSIGQTPSHALVTSGLKSKTLRKSWADKQKKKEDFLAARDRQRRLSEADAEERRENARRAKQKADLRAENEKKNQVVQVISDTRKIKNMSRKQLKNIQKMDTNPAAFKTNVVSSGPLSRGVIPKGQ